MAPASVIKVSICSCSNRSPFRSAKNVGYRDIEKYPSNSVLPQQFFCHIRNIHCLDHDIKERLKGRSIDQRKMLREKLPKSEVNGHTHKKNQKKHKTKHPAMLVNLWSW